jgi:putative redox protein
MTPRVLFSRDGATTQFISRNGAMTNFGKNPHVETHCMRLQCRTIACVSNAQPVHVSPMHNHCMRLLEIQNINYIQVLKFHMISTIDKSKQLQAAVTLVNHRLHFRGVADQNAPVSIDYVPPLGDNSGYTSLELLLLSLSSCIGSSVLTLLRKMRKTIDHFEIQAVGTRHEEHPTGFKKIVLEIKMTSPGTSKEEVLKVIAMSEEKYCPVWSMIKGNVEVQIIPVIE